MSSAENLTQSAKRERERHELSPEEGDKAHLQFLDPKRCDKSHKTISKCCLLNTLVRVHIMDL